MVWDFQRIIAGKISNLEDEAAFQADLYKNIDPRTAREIIAVTNHTNRDMQKISIPINLPNINILRSNY